MGEHVTGTCEGSGDVEPRATSVEEPDGGNLLVRIWRGAGVGNLPAYSTTLLLSLGKQYEQRGMRAQKVSLQGPFSRPPTPVAHSCAPSRCSCGSHRSARRPLGSENTPRPSGAASPCGCRALPGCCQRAQ